MWHTLDLTEVVRKLRSNINYGITNEEAKINVAPFRSDESVQSRKIRWKQKRRQGETCFSHKRELRSRTAVLRSGGSLLVIVGL